MSCKTCEGTIAMDRRPVTCGDCGSPIHVSENAK